ncbi:MAG: methylmalonyl-CoA epimerase [Anaerolineales bacterium]|nr:methylmalonyl-CoA epimerase [Anaerolineales bacterium]
MVKRIAHIALAVNDLDGSLSFWRDALGLELHGVEEVAEQQASVAFLPAGDSQIELVRPTSDTTGVAKFLAKRGPGLHHVCLEVDDLAATLASLAAQGVRLIDATPKLGAGGKLIAFVHPESTQGVLVELFQEPPALEE